MVNKYFWQIKRQSQFSAPHSKDKSLSFSLGPIYKLDCKGSPYTSTEALVNVEANLVF